MRVEGSYSGKSSRPGEGSETDRVEGCIGSFAWYDPTRAASALIQMRTDTPEWQLSKIAAEAARMGTKWRCSQIGVDWDAAVGQLDIVQDELDECYQKVFNPLVDYPTYYLEPFHAYPDGNLSWKAAKEYESAGLAVFADLFSDKPNLTGSAQFRDTFRQATKQMADVMLGRPLNPKVIVDIGCGVGLSTRRWGLVFPDAKILGIDLSPYFLALAQYRLKQDPDPNITFMHAAGEDTKLAEGSVDLVTLTTVMHELPRSAATRIFLEARRILKPGGVLSFVDMDPTEAFMKYLDGYAGLFKYGIRATEPHLIEYCSIDFEKLLKECGFSAVSRSRNTTRHCTYTACREGASVSEPSEKFQRQRLYSPSLLINSLDPIRKDMLEKTGNLCEFAPGETIYTRGSDADVVYILQSGACKASVGGRTIQTFTEKGECFGDLFWLFNYQKRRLDMVATSSCTALSLTPSFLDDLLSDTEVRRLMFAAAEKFSDELVNEGANDHGLYLSTPQTAITSRLSLLDRFPVVRRPAGTEIVRRGDAGSEIYVVKKGECVASVGAERKLCFCEGNYFGEVAALEGTPRGVTVTAESDVELWVLTASEFEEVRTAVWSPNVVLWH